MSRARVLARREEPTTPVPDQCIACTRTTAVLEWRPLSDGTWAWLCTDPADCRRHWTDGGAS